jgi:hypothetical protein
MCDDKTDISKLHPKAAMCALPCVACTIQNSAYVFHSQTPQLCRFEKLPRLLPCPAVQVICGDIFFLCQHAFLLVQNVNMPATVTHGNSKWWPSSCMRAFLRSPCPSHVLQRYCYFGVVSCCITQDWSGLFLRANGSSVNTRSHVEGCLGWRSSGIA